MAKKGPKITVFWPWWAEFWPFFYKFLQITSNYAQKHHIKKLKKIGSLKKFLSPKNCKNDKKLLFFGTGGPNFDHFFTFFCKSLLNMPKNISNNQKNSFNKKNSKSEKLDILLLLPKRVYIPNFRKFGKSDLEKMLFFCFCFLSTDLELKSYKEHS